VAISNALSDAQIGKLLAEYGYNTQAWREDLKPRDRHQPNPLKQRRQTERRQRQRRKNKD
jgi:hypothetical protein